MKKHILLTLVIALGLLSVLLPVRQAAHAQGNTPKDFVPPVVFQAAGPTADSILGTVNAFRNALGDPNGNNPPPLDRSGRREINWDGGNPNVLDTTAPVTPFNTFLNNRGAQFTTPGIGLSQAPPSGGPQDGLAGLFNNPTYGTIFTHLQPVAVVHSGRQQHHRRFVLFTRCQSQSAARHQSAGPSNDHWLRRGLHRR